MNAYSPRHEGKIVGGLMLTLAIIFLLLASYVR